MKRFLLAIPAILLILINACVQESPPASGIPTPTSTITAISTIDTLSPEIFRYLNLQIEALESSTKFNQLEHITGASYQVISVSFPQDTNSGATIFRVESRCECSRNAQCCSPTRTFVVTLMAMDDPEYTDGTIDPVIPMVNTMPVSNVEIWTYDHAKLTDVISAPWADVQSFLIGNIDGFQLAARVVQTPSP